MAITTLSNQHISASYQNLLQISSSNALYNGSGVIIPNLTVTASYATTASYFAGNSVSASYVKLAQSASYVLNAKSASFVSALTQSVQISGSLTVTGSTTLNNLLVITPRTTTPAAGTAVTGSIMMSGSSAANINLYVYTGAGSIGNGWSKITIT